MAGERMTRIVAVLAAFLTAIGMALIAPSKSQQFGFTGANVIFQANWQLPIISASGNQIIVPTYGGGPFPLGAQGNNGYLYVSFDINHWAQITAAGKRQWTYGCNSSDGSIIYIGDQPGFIYKITNLTSTGSATVAALSAFGSANWQQVSCSSDGSTIVACVGSQGNGDVWTSRDGGATAVDQTSALTRNYLNCTISGDGTKIATSNWLGQGANGDGGIYVSTNWQSGSPTWAANLFAANGSTFAQGLKYSRDGSTLYAAFNANGSTSIIYKTATDGGAWASATPAGVHGWYWIDTSANGQSVVASTLTNVYLSANAGGAYTNQVMPGPSNHQNGFQTISDNGQIIVNAVYYGFVNVSTNGTWRVTSATP
jgi:hypothetical protein